MAVPGTEAKTFKRPSLPSVIMKSGKEPGAGVRGRVIPHPVSGVPVFTTARFSMNTARCCCDRRLRLPQQSQALHKRPHTSGHFPLPDWNPLRRGRVGRPGGWAPSLGKVSLPSPSSETGAEIPVHSTYSGCWTSADVGGFERVITAARPPERGGKRGKVPRGYGFVFLKSADNDAGRLGCQARAGDGKVFGRPGERTESRTSSGGERHVRYAGRRGERTGIHAGQMRREAV
ncbi:hypothetical protein SKAU_G00252530 [Synaphobranchus kaupii]|uniref:Uncharacterized protein n=1 Tax=Synaphobranchus kaupii TaxID=118154 RepID=A0A9Q1IRR5_SYNKA|nr:hypothetical protein SKAU_G00252530 [Synaphobranchus kaupii]